MEVGEINKFVQDQEKFTREFRQELDDVLNFYTCTYFDIPNRDKTDKSYDIYNSNLPRVYADKIAEELAYGTLNFAIPPIDADHPQRTKESLTEQTAYAFIRMADENIIAPFSPPIQNQVSWFIPNTGYIVGRFWMYKNEDGCVTPDLAIWDIRNTYWALGKGQRLSKTCYVRYATKEEIDDEYNGDFPYDENGMVSVYDMWHRSDTNVVGKGKKAKTLKFKPFVETVVVGAPGASQGMKGGEKVKELNLEKDYLPIFILPTGNMPLLQRNMNMMKYMAQTCYSKNKDMWRAQSELLTYQLKNVRLATMTPFQNIFDSTKGGEQINIDKSPYKEGANIPVDKGKGQDILPFFTPVSSPDAAVVDAKINKWVTVGSLPEIYYGESPSNLTAQGTAMLIHAGAGVLKSGQRGMERFYTWATNEMIRQYKESDFPETKIEGIDGKGRQFSDKINRDSITTERQIVATLDLNKPEDELQKAGILHQYLTDNAISLQRYMDGIGVQDVDAEKRKIAQEKLEQAFPFSTFEAIDALIKDKNPEMKKYGMVMMKMATDVFNMVMTKGQQAEAGNTAPQMEKVNQAGIPAPAEPSGSMMQTPQPPVRVRQNRMNLSKAK